MSWENRIYGAVLLGAVAAAIGFAACSDYGSNPPPTGQNLELNSGNIGSGGVYQHAFADSGAFSYHCALHPCMAHGTVTVASGGLDSAIVNITSPGGGCQGAYSPLSVSVRRGGFVRWVNQSVIHTVTSD